MPELDEVAEQLGTDDHRQAYLIRGIYFEGWNPSSTPVKYRGFTDFLDRVGAEAALDGETAASYAVSAAAGVLRRHVSAGEINDVRAQLPEDLLPILG
jgi:uncharacterized protein (DUF2267 family)